MSRRAVACIVALCCCVGVAVAVRYRVLVEDQAANPQATHGGRAHAHVSEPSAAETGEEIADEEIDVAVPSAQRDRDERPLEERFPVPTGPTELPVSKIADPQSEEHRQVFWNYLRTFAAKADLTESEWQRFLGDVSDVARSEITAFETAMEELTARGMGPLQDARRLTEELAAELDERCASWMTEKQLQSYRGRLNAEAMLAMARNLRLSTQAFVAISDVRH